MNSGLCTVTVVCRVRSLVFFASIDRLIALSGANVLTFRRSHVFL